MIEVLAVTPFERPDVPLVRALARSVALPVLDLGRDARRARQALRQLSDIACAVRFPEGVSPALVPLPEGVHTVLVPAGVDLTGFAGRRVLVEVRTVAEARQAVADGADGVIGRGAEAGGRIGPENAFVLCQRLAAADLAVPFWIQGGIGPHTAAACAVAGAAGVVLEAQLALTKECSLPEPIRRAVRAMDGSETTILAGHRVFTRPDLPLSVDRSLDADAVRARLGADDLRAQLVPVGQDAALAARLADAGVTAGGVVRLVVDAVRDHLAAAVHADPVAPGNALARSHGTRHPIAQGPMTRVSDVADFAAAVASGGGLPFIALSMLRGSQAERLIADTARAVGDKPWGVGILGFVPAEVRDPQLEAIAKCRPPFALIAGGRPSQARALEAQGIATYLHVPSPSLLDAFLKDGARRFVFEGSECGGHVGPRTSFVLWEQAIDRMTADPHVAEIHALFAGGVHDGRSGAMVGAMTGPLAAAGAKVGVLMGTAYLFTEEAVATGAIRQGFQDAALQAETTALVETAPGHATRCVLSPFVTQFEAERARLEAAGADPKAMWAELEQLNLGRLRIAAKGLVREAGELLEVDADTQRDQGMFMIGQVAALRGAVTTIEALHADVTQGAKDRLTSAALEAIQAQDEGRGVAVAIVGMAAVFPDAPDVETFWRHVLASHDAVREVPPERWRADLYYAADGVPGETTPSKWGGMLPAISFDPLAYGIPPKSLVSIDPAQLLALDVSRRALDDAGYDKRPLDRARTSVIFGTESGSDLGGAYSFRASWKQIMGDMPAELDAALPRLSEDSFPGVLANVLAGRIANRLDLGGVNYTVDAACASSLAALDLAVKELALHTSDVVICGGADLHNGINDYLLFSSVHALSPTGRCRTFDADADGIVLGEGVAALVLKRLEDAERDGDRVYAVIRGVGGSSDGRHLGLTAPRKDGQKRAVERAWARAGVDRREVGLIEAHGTGTVVGDRTELQTLEETFAGAHQRITLGSVKSMIGHTKCAAGLAGLIKSALAVHHGVLPPTARIRHPNAAWNPALSPFEFTSGPRPWPAARRVAGVSAFGFGGTNFHAVLEAHDARPVMPAVRPAELFVLRGDDARVDRTLDQLAAWLDADAPASLGALARAACFAAEGPVRVAIVADSHEALRARLPDARKRRAVEGAVFVASAPVQGQTALLFPGQGSQRVHMLRDLFLAMPELQGSLAEAPELAARIFPADAFDDVSRKAQQAALTDTRVAQPALGLVGLAAAAFLERVGVHAAMAGGHSYGELAALAWAGAVDPDDLLALSTARAAAMLDAAPADPGAMAAVRGTPDEVARHLGAHPQVVLANHNAPSQTVVAGPTEAVDAFVAALEAAGVSARRIPVAAAFHSPLVAAGSATFRAALEQVELVAPRVPVWSNTIAAPHPSTPSGIRDLLARQIAEPVRFVDQIEAMYAAGARVFVEAGPGRVLTGLVDKILGARPHLAVPLEIPGEPGWASTLGALATLLTHGVTVDVGALFAERDLPDLELARPPRRSASLWLVDGMRARPAVGEAPAGGLVPILEPIGLTITQHVPPPSDDREAAVMGFLQNMAAIAEAQRDVMLGLLGAVPAAPRAVAAPTPQPAARPAPLALVTEAPRAALVPSLGLADTLLEVVSDRTGYPPEMLDPTLDLEADLSIDSIKRIEILNALGERLGLADSGLDDEALEALAARRTLADIVSWLEERGMGRQATAAPAGAMVPKVDVLATLLEVVSDRTGYPAEMLDPDLDLEADLSIDSIKRIEILNALGERMGTDADSMDDEAMEALAARRTLREIVAWLDAQDADRDARTVEAEEVVVVTSPVASVQRYRLVAEPAPLEVDGGIPIKPFAVLDHDAKRGKAIAKALQGAGLPATVADGSTLHDTVLHVDGTGPVAMFPEVKQLLESGVRTLVGVDAGGNGLEGLFKTAAREYPDRTVRLVTLDAVHDAKAILAHVPPELMAATGPSHVRYRDNHRETMVVRPAPLDRGSRPLPFDTDAVVLVTGGARGITARIAEALAGEVPCTYVLVGRSALPDLSSEADLTEAADGAALRKALVARGLRKPAEIEAKVQSVLKAREAHATLDALRAAGATVDYRAVDVSDEAAFRALLDDLYATHGRLDGVVHGAGVLEDKLMKDKSAASFQRVYDTKVTAARVLAEVLRPDTRFVVFFGSISGVLGNRGQADYASANATLDAIAQQLGDRIEGRVVAIDWGPWGGAGMVSDELARAYEKRGIALIDVDEGVNAFLDELRHGDRSDRQVIWQAGDPSLFGGGAG